MKKLPLALFLGATTIVSLTTVTGSVNLRNSLQQSKTAQKSVEVSDLVATELFLRTIASRPSTTGSYRPTTRGLAKKAGIEGADYDALLNFAHDFVRNLAPLDRQVAEFKNQHWPNPNQQAMSHLSSLQAQKEALIAAAIPALPSRLGSDTTEKVRQYAVGAVKSRTKRVPGPGKPPGHQEHVGYAFSSRFYPGMVLSIPPLSQDMSGVAYCYSDSWWDSEDRIVCGSGAITEDYNNYNHEYQNRLTITSPGGGRSAGFSAGWAGAPIAHFGFLPEEMDEGPFSIESESEAMCPLINSLIFLSFDFFQQQLPPRVFVDTVTWDQQAIARSAGCANLLVQVAATSTVSAGTTITVEAFQSVVPQNMVLTIEPLTGRKDISMPGGGQSGTASFQICSAQNNTIAGFFRYRGRVLSVPAPLAIGGSLDGVQSPNLCVGRIDGANCV